MSKTDALITAADYGTIVTQARKKRHLTDLTVTLRTAYRMARDAGYTDVALAILAAAQVVQTRAHQTEPPREIPHPCRGLTLPGTSL